MTARHGGWRGPVDAHRARRRLARQRLAAQPLPAGAATVGWQLAVVLAHRSDGAAIGFADGEPGISRSTR